MKIFTEKKFFELTKPFTKEHRQTIAWLSASFGRNLMYYDAVSRHPEDYRPGANKTAVTMTIRDFKEICDQDMECARMLYETYWSDLWKMVRETFGEEPSEYFKFYYFR